VASAKKLYQGFSGKVDRRTLRTGIRYGEKWLTAQGQLNILIPADLAIIGHVNALEYDCVRDGKRVKARHVFAPGGRPVFAVGSRRGQLFLLGTAFKFTDRGIVDFDAQGRAIDYDEKTRKTRLLR
jgi:hypothetical protein